MRAVSYEVVVPALLAGIAVAACRSTPRAAEPPRGQPTVEVSSAVARPGHTAADVRFMQNMIGHHAQALDMTALVAARTTRPEMRLLAERIAVSQKDEINLMRRWLQSRGEEAPDPSAHAHHGASHSMLMPGMLTPEQLEALAKTTGSDFDRLFLEDMIRHHEGALTMVSELFGTNGAAQESETYRFASDVEADQRAEIARMRALLQTVTDSAPPR